MKSVISLTSTVIAVALTHLVKSSTALPSGYDLQRRAAPAGTGYTCSRDNIAGKTEVTVQWTELLKKANLGDSDIRVGRSCYQA